MTQRFSETFNWPLFGIVMGLLIIGLMNLYSAVYHWEEGGATALFWNQLMWVGIGLLLMIALSFVDYRIFRSLSWGAYALSLTLLLIALLFGTAVHGTRGWIQLGGVSLQPTEFAKIAFILAAARFFAEQPQPEGYSSFGLWQPLLLMLFPCGLVVLQGDMGSSLFFICIFGSLAFFAGIRRRTIIIWFLLAACAGGAVYAFGLKEYQRDRILTFLHPEADIRGSGYHLMQSKIAVGSGMMFGKGYLKGTINKLQYLPERHTDFIFPVLAEEWGFAGCSVVLGLFASLLLLGVDIAQKARDRFGIFLVIGVLSMIFWQLVINLGGVLGLMPLTGVTLPFLSYGGSSIIALLMGIGLLMSVSLRRFMF